MRWEKIQWFDEIRVGLNEPGERYRRCNGDTWGDNGSDLIVSCQVLSNKSMWFYKDIVLNL